MITRLLVLIAIGFTFAASAGALLLENATYFDDLGSELNIEQTRINGVQQIKIVGRQNDEFQWFQLYYNSLTDEFYTDFAPETAWSWRTMFAGESAHYFQESNRYSKTTKLNGKILTINLTNGHVGTDESRKVHLKVDLDRWRITDVSFAIVQNGVVRDRGSYQFCQEELAQ